MNREKDTAVAASRDEEPVAWWYTTTDIDGDDWPWSFTQTKRVAEKYQQHGPLYLHPPKALTVNTSTPGNDLAASRMEEVEKRLLKLELAVSILMPDRSDDI